MVRLVLLNGPPGSGKSTLARMYVDQHPLALNLDVDRIRSLLGHWQARQQESGLLARELAQSMARVHLLAGHDVVVPQYLARPRFIEQLERLAADVGAAFTEVVLLDSKANAVRRFVERSRTSKEPAHVEARELVDAEGGPEALALMYDDLVLLLAARPEAKVLTTYDGQISTAYDDLVRHLGQ